MEKLIYPWIKLKTARVMSTSVTDLALFVKAAVTSQGGLIYMISLS
jgi:hypothetical protein